ncbi:hypothetical protein ACFX13_030168 [Malus domestica]
MLTIAVADNELSCFDYGRQWRTECSSGVLCVLRSWRASATETVVAEASLSSASHFSLNSKYHHGGHAMRDNGEKKK